MKKIILIVITTLALNQAAFSKNTDKVTEKESLPTYKLKNIIHDFAVRNKQQILVDPRVVAKVRLYGKEKSDIDKSDLFAILNIHGYSMVKVNNLNIVMPLVNIKQTNAKINTGEENDFSGSEIVTSLIEVKNIPVSQLVPILRPLVPQQGHLAAYGPTNKIILTDSYTNSQRIRSIIKFLDTKTDVTFTMKCKDEE